MTTLQWSASAMLVLTALWVGNSFAVAIERTSVWQRMSLEEYAVDFRRSIYCLDPLQPILLVLSAIAMLVFALSATGTAAVLGWVGIGLSVLIVGVSTGFAEPINSQFRRLPEGEVPPNADALRTKWRYFHRTRTVVGILTLVVLVLSRR